MDNFKDFVEMLKTGGPAVSAALFLWAWWDAKKENKTLQKELLALSVAQVKATIKMEAALLALKDVIDRILK